MCMVLKDSQAFGLIFLSLERLREKKAVKGMGARLHTLCYLLVQQGVENVGDVYHSSVVWGAPEHGVDTSLSEVYLFPTWGNGD